MYPGSKLRTGFLMKVSGDHLTRPDLHILAAELGITTRDVLIKMKYLPFTTHLKYAKRL